MKQSIIDILGDCKNHKCVCEPKHESFIELTDKEVYIFDDNDITIKRPIRLVTESEEFHIKVSNKSEFVIVKNDACLVTDNSVKKCDVLIYNDKEFYFLEIKDRKVKSKAKKVAYKQLLSSVKQLRLLDFGSRIKYAVVGFPKPHSTIISSSNNTKKSEFKDGFGIHLMEGQEIVLS